MALRTLVINKRLKEIENRELEIRDELDSLEKTEQAFITRFNDHKDDDSEINDLFEKSEELDKTRDGLNSELEEILAERDKLTDEIKTINEGEKVETKIKKTNEVEERDELNAYFHSKQTKIDRKWYYLFSSWASR